MNKMYALALLPVLIAAAGCSSGNSASAPTTPTTPTTPAATPALYTETNATGGNEVMAYSRASNGSLTSIGAYSTSGLGQGLPTNANALPFPIGGSTGSVVLNPAGTFLYAVDAGSNDVAAFSVGTDATLTFIANYPTGGIAPGSIAIDSTGAYLYVLNTGNVVADALGAGATGDITGFTIGSTGALTALANSTQPLSTGTGGAYVDASEIAFAPGGASLVVTEKLGLGGTGAIDIYPVTAGVAGTGTFTPSTGVIPFGFAFTSSGAFVVSNVAAPPSAILGGTAENLGSATSYTIAAGAPTVVSATVGDNQNAPCWLVLTPSVSYAYAVNTISGSVSGYSVSSTGALTLLAPASGATATATLTPPSGGVAGPIDEIVSPDGAYLYVIQSNFGGSPGSIEGFSISSTTGALTSVNTGITGLPEGSIGLAVR
ncbi:MAG TPA: beta-propeller fold lactonase family protein [Terracidiphilus sp.]|nr:beta-propeller fold lactonase family protein [Terracidiphilus sp.]